MQVVSPEETLSEVDADLIDVVSRVYQEKSKTAVSE